MTYDPRSISKGSIPLLVIFGLILPSDVVKASITTTPIPLQAGQTYIIPSPIDLSNMYDYQVMVAQCGTNAAQPSCITAMNQFLSDVYLMVPDTKSYVTTLNDKVSSNKDKSTAKQTSLSSLQTTISTWITNLATLTQSMDAADTDYYNKLGYIVSSVSALQDAQSSPVITAASTLDSTMQTKLNDLDTAATDFLSSRRDQVKGVADYIYSLFKNEQAVVAYNAANARKTASASATTLQNQMNDIRGYFQGNMTTEANNLAGMKLRVAAAKADADAKAAGAKATIVNTVQAGIADAMTAAYAAFQTQAASVQSAIDAERNSSITTYDGYLSQALKDNAAADADINTNLTGTQTGLNQLTQSVDLKLSGANTTATGTLETLTASQGNYQKSINSKITALNASISTYVTKAGQTTSNIFGQSQSFMQSFSNLATDAASAAQGSMKAGASAEASNLSGLNSIIGSLSGGASASSSASASVMADQVNGARESAARTNLKQVAALADAINTMNALVELLKSKLAFASDKQDVNTNSIQGLLTNGADRLLATLNEITKQATDSVNAISTSTGGKLGDMKLASNKAQQDLNNQLSEIGRGLNGQINSVTVKRNDVVQSASVLEDDGAQFANQIAKANKDLYSKVQELQKKISSDWQVVSDANARFSSAVNTTLTGFETSANKMADDQLAAAQKYIGDQSLQFSGLVSDSVKTSLDAQQSALTAANAAVADLQSAAQQTQVDASKLVSDTVNAVAATVTSANLVPPLLVQVGSETDAKLVKLKTVAITALNGKIDQSKSDLLKTISEYTTGYRKNSTDLLDPVDTSVKTLATSVKAQQDLLNKLFPAGTALFSLSADDFKSLLESASSQVSKAQLDLDSKYSSLNSDLVSAYTNLSTLIADAGNSVQALTANVSSGLAGSKLALQQQIQSDKSELDDFGSSQVEKFLEAKSAEEAATRALVAGKQSDSDSVISNGNKKFQEIVESVTGLSTSESAKQEALANAMDDIVKSVIDSSGNNAMVLQNIQSQFETLKSSAAGISDKLKSSLDHAVTSLTAASKTAAANLDSQIAQQNHKSLVSIGSLGDRLAFAMDTLAKNSDEDQASLASADADAWALAQAVQALGEDAKSNIRAALTKILSGQSRIEDVIKSSSNVDVAQLTTMSDVIDAFVAAVEKNVEDVSGSFEKQTGKLTDFDSAIPTLVASYKSAIDKAITNARLLTSQLSADASSYQRLVNATRTDASKAVQDAQASLVTAKAAFPVALDTMKNVIRKAVEAVEDSQDVLAKGLIDAAQASEGNIAGKLRAFRSARHRESYSLSTESVELPTAAPRLVLS